MIINPGYHWFIPCFVRCCFFGERGGCFQGAEVVKISAAMRSTATCPLRTVDVATCHDSLPGPVPTRIRDDIFDAVKLEENSYVNPSYKWWTTANTCICNIIIHVNVCMQYANRNTTHHIYACIWYSYIYIYIHIYNHIRICIHPYNALQSSWLQIQNTIYVVMQHIHTTSLTIKIKQPKRSCGLIGSSLVG